jgi:hypothetical protein
MAHLTVFVRVAVQPMTDDPAAFDPIDGPHSGNYGDLQRTAHRTVNRMLDLDQSE